MRYAVIGGDIRLAHLVRMLNESGRTASGFLQEKAGNANPLARLKNFSCVIANWPLRWPLSDAETSEAEIMNAIAPGTTLLLCGPGFPSKRRWDLEYINIWADEELLVENAYLTAEGAVAALMSRTQCKLPGMDVLVVGYGRIGRALTEILTSIGVHVTVATGSQAKRRQIADAGAAAIAMDEIAEAVAGKQIILSTPPSEVLGEEALQHVDSQAMIVDLASPPYGFDLDAAQQRGLDAWREPGLPGRYCPERAARAIYAAILRWEADQHE